MDKKKPVLDFCLLIPCYNNLEGLVISLKTVHYNPNRFLVVVVDDGSSTPVSQPYLEKELGNAIPVQVLRNRENAGITASLNKGLEWIIANVEATYIARLDCGDICENERFIKQVAFMDQHTDIGLTGTWCKFVDEGGLGAYFYKSPVKHKAIVRDLYFRNSFMHATVMFRTEVVKKAGLYPTNFEYAEDYAFFWRISQVTQVAILDEVLVVCKVNRSGISYGNKGKQLAARRKVVSSFSSSGGLRMLAFVRTGILLILPKRIILWIKKLRG